MTLDDCKVTFGGWPDAYKQWKEVPLNPQTNLWPSFSRKSLHVLSMRACVYHILDPLSCPLWKAGSFPPPKVPLSAAKSSQLHTDAAAKSRACMRCFVEGLKIKYVTTR